MTYKISDIEKLYPNWYNESSDLSYEDQKLVWEITPIPDMDEQKLKQIVNHKETSSVNGSVSESDSVVRKFDVNQQQIWSKSPAISKLNTCNAKTAPYELASLLETIFGQWVSKDTHWLWVARHYTAKTIISVMKATIKKSDRGEIWKDPPSCFTYCIKRRKKRIQFRKTKKLRRKDQSK